MYVASQYKFSLDSWFTAIHAEGTILSKACLSMVKITLSSTWLAMLLPSVSHSLHAASYRLENSRPASDLPQNIAPANTWTLNSEPWRHQRGRKLVYISKWCPPYSPNCIVYALIQPPAFASGDEGGWEWRICGSYWRQLGGQWH